MLGPGMPVADPTTGTSLPNPTTDSQPLQDVPTVLIPGHHNAPAVIGDLLSFIPSSNDTTPVMEVPNPNEPSTGTQLDTEQKDGNQIPTTLENSVPLPVLVDPSSAEAAVPDPAELQGNTQGPTHLNRTTLTLKARALEARATGAEKERLHFENERKKAIEEGRKRDAILREGDRDAAAARALKYRQKSTKYRFMGMHPSPFFLVHSVAFIHLVMFSPAADNVDLPRQTIDVHHSDISHAIQVIKERYRQILTNGDKQLRVLTGSSRTSHLHFLPAELKKSVHELY
jgi:hypothetical protein